MKHCPNWLEFQGRQSQYNHSAKVGCQIYLSLMRLPALTPFVSSWICLFRACYFLAVIFYWEICNLFKGPLSWNLEPEWRWLVAWTFWWALWWWTWTRKLPSKWMSFSGHSSYSQPCSSTLVTRYDQSLIIRPTLTLGATKLTTVCAGNHLFPVEIIKW